MKKPEFLNLMKMHFFLQNQLAKIVLVRMKLQIKAMEDVLASLLSAESQGCFFQEVQLRIKNYEKDYPLAYNYIYNK